MSEACTKFDTPVTGGNVSFYNQSPSGPVYPTPVIGMVGLLEDYENKMTLDFKSEGDVIYLLGKNPEDFNCSEYLHKICGIEYSPAPYFNLDEEFRLHHTVSLLIKDKMILSAHDISEGGLFITLSESGFHRNFGFAVNQQISGIRKDAYWFGEAQGRVVVSVNAEKINEFESAIEIPFEKLGTVTPGEIVIDDQSWGNISEWKNKYDHAIDKYLNKEELV
jgi:phosphoribosylformylglycinamidine synthase subunit PurL